jgi:hypothetical protein
MPAPENGKTIEKKYWELVRAMSPAEKYRKTLSLNASVRAMVEFQIREKRPDISDRDMQFAVARRRYWSEPKVLQMLDEMEKTEKEHAND